MFNSVKTITIKVKYSKQHENDYYIENGSQPPELSFVFEPEDMTSEQRKQFQALGFSSGSYQHNLTKYQFQHTPEGRFNNKPHVSKEQIYFFHEPSRENILNIIKTQADDKVDADRQVADAMPAWKQEKEEKREQERIKREESEERAEAEEERRLAESIAINWKSGKALFDLYTGIMTASDLGIDHRYNSWCKQITAVDKSKSNGYMFEGDFVDEGTVEISQSDYSIFLAASRVGSRKYNTMSYQIVILKDGKLQKLDIADNDDKPGWALRMRDQVADLVNGAHDPEPTVTMPVEMAQQIFNVLNMSSLDDVQELAIKVADLLNS